MNRGCLITGIVGMLAQALVAGGEPGTLPDGSSLVLVNVSVLDSRDEPVTTLSQRHFHVLDNGQEQRIRYFGHEDAPVSLGIVLDGSGSMERKWDRARSMVARLCENLAPGDDLFLVTVQKRARLAVDYTSDCDNLQGQLVKTLPHGASALLDAIPLALQHLRKAKNPRRAILIVSDSGEIASRVGAANIQRQAREGNAQIYAATLGLLPEFDFDAARRPGERDERHGPELLKEIAERTGGRAFAIDDSRQIGEVAAAAAREIHDQYLIGYLRPATAADGKRHRIVIRVLRDPETPGLSAVYRTSYQARLE